MQTIAAMIRKAREKKGMTQVELGQAIGLDDPNVAQVTISKYERGVNFPQRNLKKLMEVLRLPKKTVLELLLENAWAK